MGLLDSIRSSLSSQGGSQPQGGEALPFKFSTSFRPVRLRAMSQNSCELLISIKNTSAQAHICSIVVEVANSLGFDSMGLHKKKELRLGSLEPSASKEISVPITANNQTPAGNYRIFITAYSHYRDYSHVLNSVRKSAELRVV
ncbi:MAG: hypothetical protein V1822_03755 [Candidatus Micrarchaeota archaeon]